MPVTRALLVSCERFVTQESLSPSASISVMNMARTLARNGGELQSIHTEINTIGTLEQLQQAIENTFAGAGEGDVSLFYIATHGNFRTELRDAQPTLTLSNGKIETTFAGGTLREMLNGVPGVKLVFIDACNSGALIDKGVNLSRQTISSAGDLDAGYKVLTSASGNELSWHFSENRGEENGSRRVGGSYFGSALSKGLGLDGTFPADLNRDGQITLDELYRYLLQNNAVSTVQVYPQRDSFVLLEYDRETPPEPDAYAVGDIAFQSEVIRADQPNISFTFTVHRAIKVEYRITYYRNGNWDWDGTRRFADTFDGQAEGEPLSPGRKVRHIQMPGIEEDSAGYALLQIMVVEEEGLSILSSRLISVLPVVGDPELSVELPSNHFLLWQGQELSIYVRHAFPLRLSLTIQDSAGNLVCRVAEHQLTRPLQLEPEGSVFYWNGKDQYDNPVPQGDYTIVAETWVGGTFHQTEPLAFQVTIPAQ